MNSSNFKALVYFESGFNYSAESESWPFFVWKTWVPINKKELKKNAPQNSRPDKWNGPRDVTVACWILAGTVELCLFGEKSVDTVFLQNSDKSQGVR